MTTDRIVVVYGPMASGKTHNAVAIAAHYDCDKIIDNFPENPEVGDFSGGGATTGPGYVLPGTLLLVTAAEVSAYALRRAVVASNAEMRDVHMMIVPISEALEVIAPSSLEPVEFDSVEGRHSEMVAALIKDGALIKHELTPGQAHLWHMGTGVAGEAGELLDAIKKHVVYQKPLDIENVIEELGDIEFYLEAVRAALGIKRETTLVHNMAKLSKRYEAGKFSNEAAQARADKA
jgi:NTP pyrophosphatase (non-canonical NTP hydrolase)